MILVERKGQLNYGGKKWVLDKCRGRGKMCRTCIFKFVIIDTTVRRLGMKDRYRSVLREWVIDAPQ
jgi:hypothetical protein